nr:hypothetical protein [Tanacetum cinerariifolium]
MKDGISWSKHYFTKWRLGRIIDEGVCSLVNKGSSCLVREKLFAATNIWYYESSDFCLLLASGLKINIQKSNVYSIRVSDVDVSSMARGRHTLIKVVLGSLGSHEARKLAWIKLKNVPTSYDNDSLNINSLKAFNLALFQKWRWRLLSYKNALRVKVIKALGGQECGFDNNGCIYNDMLYRLEREKDCLIIDRIDHGQWRWNWSRPNLGARNSADILNMIFEISSAKINEVDDTYFGTKTFLERQSVVLLAMVTWKLQIIFSLSVILPRTFGYLFVVKEKSRRISVIFSSSLWWLW